MSQEDGGARLEIEDLISSIASTISDYRSGELPQPTPDHVSKWVSQFDEAARVPLLTELDYVLKRTYFRRERVARYLRNVISSKNIAGPDPDRFWREAHFLDIQIHGQSQHRILELVDESLREACGFGLEGTGHGNRSFFYVDDFLFEGQRLRSDLESWIINTAPEVAVIYIVMLASHTSGEWRTLQLLQEATKRCNKQIEIHVWKAISIENRLKFRNESEVLWPSEYLAEPTDRDVPDWALGFQPRKPGGKPEDDIFSGESGRQVLEEEFLAAGVKIRSFPKSPDLSLRPLGRSHFSGPGLGSMFASYLNCPNNTPLALWWGDPDAGPPLDRWHPLLKRRPHPPSTSGDTWDQESLFQ